MSGVEGVSTAELDIGGIAVLTNPTWVVTNHGAAFIDLLRENAVSRVQVFRVATGEDAVDLVILNPGLELGPQLRSKGKALLLAGEVHDVFAGIHHRSSACWKLERLS